VAVGWTGVPAPHPTENTITNVNPRIDPKNFPRLISPSFLGGHEPSRPKGFNRNFFQYKNLSAPFPEFYQEFQHSLSPGSSR
jgi:hypothetical protein